MAFTVATATSEGNGTSHTVAIPDGAASGKRVEVWFSSDGNPTVTIPTSPAFTRYFADVTVTDATLSVFYRDLDGTEGFSGTGDTVTVSTSAAERTAHAAYLISGHDTGTAPEGASSTGASGNVDPPSLDPAGWATEEALWVCGGGLRFAGSFTAAPANYTNLLNRQTAGGDAGATVGSARRVLSAASEDPGTFTNTDAGNWVAGTTVHRPAAAGDATASPAVIATTTTLPQPAVSVAAAPAVTATTATVPQAAATVGAAPAVTAATVALPQATAGESGDATASPTAIAATSTLPQPAVSVAAAPGPVATTVALPAAGVGVTEVPDTIAAVAALPAATVAVAAAPAAIATTATVPDADVSVGAAPGTITVVTTLPLVEFAGDVAEDVNPVTVTVRDRGHTATIEDRGHTVALRDAGHTVTVREQH